MITTILCSQDLLCNDRTDATPLVDQFAAARQSGIRVYIAAHEGRCKDYVQYDELKKAAAVDQLIERPDVDYCSLSYGGYYEKVLSKFTLNAEETLFVTNNPVQQNLAAHYAIQTLLIQDMKDAAADLATCFTPTPVTVTPSTVAMPVPSVPAPTMAA